MNEQGKGRQMHLESQSQSRFVAPLPILLENIDFKIFQIL